ncbi:unnamed protein product, partial [Symbiodinium pilosum]
MSLQRVAQELRNQFADADVKKKDTSRKYHGYVGDLLGESEDEPPTAETSFNAETELTPEGLALWSENEEEIQNALATLQTTRRTLREARERQKQVKQSRQYYRYGSKKGESYSQREDRITCLKCGKTGHKAAACPNSPAQASMVEMAPFICFAQEESMGEEAWAAHRGQDRVTTSEAVATRKAVIDCGATKSIGSVQALERLMQLSQHGVSQVDTADRPVFGFGNNSEDRCISTLHVKIRAAEKPGVMKIHALDQGAGPILLSVSTLKALGAMIDFAEGTMVLRHVSNQRLLFLEESQTGHLLLPLVDDLLAGAKVLSNLGENPVPSWTKVELRHRIAEKTGEDMARNIKTKQKAESPYQQLIKELNRASNKKKADVIEFCQTKLGMSETHNKTIPQLQMDAMKKIM